MGRHVLSTPRAYRSSSELRSMLSMEYILSILQILATAAFSLGCFSYTSMIPYISRFRWSCFLISGSLFALLNARDLFVILRGTEYTTEGKDNDVKLRLERNYGGLINWDTFSSLAMTVGSLMMFNSALIATIKSADDGACRWQFLGSFGAYVTGYASNTLSLHEEVHEVLETRNVVVFQMSVASTLNLVSALLDAPGLVCDQSSDLQATVRAWLHAIGGTLAMVAALVNHFHTLAFMMNEEVLYGERQYRVYLDYKAKLAEEDAARASKSIFQRVWESVLSRLETDFGRGHQDESLGDNENGQNVYVSLSSDSITTGRSQSSLSAQLLVSSESDANENLFNDEIAVDENTVNQEIRQDENELCTGREFEDLETVQRRLLSETESTSPSETNHLHQSRPQVRRRRTGHEPSPALLDERRSRLYRRN